MSASLIYTPPLEPTVPCVGGFAIRKVATRACCTCGAAAGDFHSPGCTSEPCPLCDRLAVACDHTRVGLPDAARALAVCARC
jgi:hypothetical protein